VSYAARTQNRDVDFFAAGLELGALAIESTHYSSLNAGWYTQSTYSDYRRRNLVP
jgi:hypothetical protein